MDQPRPLRDPSPGTWVNSRLSAHEPGSVGLVGSTVPTGFERVVRVLHPAGDGRSWAQVAQSAGRMVHPLVQWPCIASDFNGSWRSGDVDPAEGSVPTATLEAILDHCPSQERVLQGVWDGYGLWQDLAEPKTLMPGWGGRSYRLFSTPKAAIMTWPGMDSAWSQSANLVWPADHSWCIATEIDWDGTLVAGSDDIVDAILADVRLEAFEVGYEDDLSWCGDTLNPRPDWLARQCPTA